MTGRCVLKMDHYCMWVHWCWRSGCAGMPLSAGLHEQLPQL
jgi:hypothetical protein